MSGLCDLVGTRPLDPAAGTDAVGTDAVPGALVEDGLTSNAPKTSSKSLCGVWLCDGEGSMSEDPSKDFEPVSAVLAR